MKLFVWQNVLVDYTAGVMFALANDVAEARELICPGWHDKRRRCTEAGDDPVMERPHWGTMERELAREPEVHEKPWGMYLWGGS